MRAGRTLKTDTQLVVIDDSTDHLELFADAVSSLSTPCEKKFFQRGEEAIKFLTETSLHTGAGVARSLVLLDWKLTTMSGEDVLRQVRALPKHRFTPMVVVSSSRESSDIRRAYLAGANSYVCKPVRFERYREVMRALSEYWLGFHEHLTE